MSLEQFSKATREIAKNLRIIDDALFRLIAEREGVCEEILRTLLNMPELVVVKVTAQSVVKSLHREVTLDALCILDNEKYINIEMQKSTDEDDVVRTRFHSAALTAAYTPKGTDFSDVPQVTVLYVTEYDALKNGQPITHVKRCMETKEGFVPVDDKEDIFFANTVIKDGSDQSELLQLFLRRDAFNNAKFPRISEAIGYFKKTEGGNLKMCKSVENYAREYAKEYAKESKKMDHIEILQRMIRRGDNIQQILELGFTEDEYHEAESSLLTQV